MSALSVWIVSSLVLGLRIAPVFAFAPPFSLIPVPRLFRLLFGLGLAVVLVTANPTATLMVNATMSTVALAAMRELMLGIVFVLAFELAFAALYVAGRTIDIQAGYGLAVLIDPTSRAQTPLVGSLFAYTAGAAFFGADGHLELLRLFGASLDAIPLGTWTLPNSLDRITAFTSVAFLSAFGVAGAAILTLFLVDLTIALLSRTVPQLNVLILGFQVKTIVLMLVLSLTFGIGSAFFIRLMSTMLQAIPEMLR